MGLIVSVRQKNSADSTTTAFTDIGIHPSKKHAITLEIPHPFTKIVESRPDQIELNIIHDEPETLGFLEEKQQFPELSPPEEKQEPEVLLAPDTAEALPRVSQELTAPDEPVSSRESTIIDEFSTEYEEIPIRRSTLISEQTSGLIPDTSRELTGSGDLISPQNGVIAAEFSTECDEIPAAPGMPSPVPALPDEGLPVTLQTDYGGEEPVPVSLLIPVKSLSSLREKNEFSDTGSPLPERKEPAVTSPDETETSDIRVSEELKIVSPYAGIEEKTGPILPHEASTTNENPIGSQETINPVFPKPVNDESPAVPGQDSLTLSVLPEGGNGSDGGQQSPQGAPPPPPGLPPPSAGPGSRITSLIAVAVIVIIILGIAGLMVIYPQTPVAPPAETTPLPTPSIQQTPQPTPVIIPSKGVWVRVDYPHTYAGWVGNTGAVRAVNGSGNQIYVIPERDGIVQVQVHKTDNSGDTLTVEVYRDGNVINQRNVSIPMGSIDLLVDAKTGNPPGLTPVITPTANQTGSSGARIMYF
jgi:hypothetical protein